MTTDDLLRSESRIYTKKSVNIATFFGGPIVAGYMISENFKVFGNADGSRKALINGVFGTALFFTALLAIPQRFWILVPAPIANSILPAICTGLGAYFMERSQGRQIKEHVERGGGTHSGWKAAGIGLVGMLMTLTFVVGQALVVGMFSPEIEGKKISGLGNKNRVYYEASDSTRVAEVIDTLVACRFFDVNYDFFFKIEQSNDSIRFLFPAVKSAWSSPEIVGHYAAYKSMMERAFPGMTIDFELFQDGFAGREFRTISFQNDSLSLWWLKKPSEKESDSLIAERSLSYLAFWRQFFQYGVTNELKSMQWPSIPTALNFASNGMAMIESESVPDAWKDIFYDDASSWRAYRYLSASFGGIRWPSNAVIFKSYVQVLGEMEDNLRRISTTSPGSDLKQSK